MRHELRRSLPAKVVALSFILLILIGNFWMVERLLGNPPQLWMQVCFLIGTAGALGGGLFLGALALRRLWDAKEKDQTSEDEFS